MLIYNAEIHTMDSDEMLPNGWVEVREGKITDIGSGAPNLIPEDCIDAKAPGLPGAVLRRKTEIFFSFLWRHREKYVILNEK